MTSARIYKGTRRCDDGQRGPTLIINVEPSAQLYDGIYVGEGPSMDDRDLINASIPCRS